MDRLHPTLTVTGPAASSRGARGATRGLAGLLVMVALTLAGCAGPRQLENTFESDEVLARTVLDGIARQDREALVRMAVTRDEFETLVWPTLRVSRPEVGMPVDYIWQDTFTKSRMYLSQTLAQFGGTRYELVRVQFRGETIDHGTHTISRRTELVIRDAERDRTVRLFGSIIRQNGRSKILSYIVD